MGTYSDHEQRMLDQESGAEMDKVAARSKEIEPCWSCGSLPCDHINNPERTKDWAWRMAAMLRFLKENTGECLGDHPSWIDKIDHLLQFNPEQ